MPPDSTTSWQVLRKPLMMAWATALDFAVCIDDDDDDNCNNADNTVTQ